MTTNGSRPEHGAISAIGAVGLLMAISLAGLAVDLGHVFYQQRGLQKVADLAALSAATQIGNPSLATSIATSIAAQNETAEDVALDPLQFGMASPASPNGLAPVPVGGAPDAVRVEATTTVDYFFIPGELALRAAAVATNQPLVDYQVGSYLASLDTADAGILGAVISNQLGMSTTLVGYQGLAAANVRLGDLATGLGFGTVDDMLNADITAAQLGAATLSALGPEHEAQASLLQQINAGITNATQFQLGRFIQVDTSDEEAAADSEVNVLDLIGFGAQLANEDAFITMDLPVTVPGLLTAQLTFQAVQPPVRKRAAPGPFDADPDGRAHTAQVRARLMLQADLLGVATVNLPLYLETASADVRVAGATCGPAPDTGTATLEATASNLNLLVGQVSNEVFTNTSSPLPTSLEAVTIAQVSVANLVNSDLVNSAGLGPVVGGLLGGPLTPLVEGLLGGPLIEIKAVSSLSLPSGEGQMLSFEGPYGTENAEANTRKLQGTQLGLGAAPGGLSLRAYVGSTDVTALLGAIAPTLFGALSGVFAAADAQLAPVLQAVGLSTAGADVTVFGLSCDGRRLIQ